MQNLTIGDDEEKDESKVLRKGRPVIKTTVEFDDEVYSEMKIKAMESHKTLKDFLTEAAIEKIRKDGSPTSIKNILDQEIEANKFAKRVLELLSQEIPEAVAKVVLAQKCHLKGIEVMDLGPANMDEELIKLLGNAINHFSGESSARSFMDKLREILSMMVVK
jgi:hypothetical protein